MTYIWNLAAMKGREKPKTRKVEMPMATGTLRVGPEGKGTVGLSSEGRSSECEVL